MTSYAEQTSIAVAFARCSPRTRCALTNRRPIKLEGTRLAKRRDMKKYLVLAIALVACKKSEKPQRVTATDAGFWHADVGLAGPVIVDPEWARWETTSDALPQGARMSLLEGTQPFREGRTFAFLLELPAKYTLARHSHPVTERIAVLRGALDVAIGDAPEPARVVPGDLVLIPAGYPHTLRATEHAIVDVQGVGPWETFYADPTDDPRKTLPPMPPKGSQWDAAIAPSITRAKDVKFVDPPAGMMPAGTKIARLEGNPQDAKTFTMQIQLPGVTRIAPTKHAVAMRLLVVSGTLRIGFGDAWNAATFKEVGRGGVALIPQNTWYFAETTGPTVLQMFGVGPLELEWNEQRTSG
jgi:mannose-6-phosphate isomerase-like protein (cupin superfamily)